MSIIKVGACLKAENNPFWAVEMRKGLEESSKEYNDIRLAYRTPERITDVEKQKIIIKELISKKVNVLIIAPTDPIRIVDSVVLANKKGIPVIIVDTDLDQRIVKKKQADYKFLGFNDYKGGYDTGELFIEQLKSNSQIAIIEGPTKGSFTDRVKGFSNVCKNKLNIVSVECADFEEDKAYQKTKKIIKNYPNVKAIFCTSDNMAMGCLTAINEAKKNILVSGFDATHAGILAIKNKKLLSTVNTNPEEIGRRAIQLAKDLYKNRIVSTKTELSIELLTINNLPELPKHVVQKRKYIILKPENNLREYNYSKLEQSTECPVLIGNNMNKDLPKRLKLLAADKYIIITDYNVEKLYGKKLLGLLKKNRLSASIQSIPADEHNKTFTVLNELANKILDEGISKKSCLVLLGGGVLGNIAGFLAGILMRGVRFVHVPTTVTAQIDSTTGGKQAVNTIHGKNLLGMYYEPEFIYIDLSTVKSLPKKHYIGGLAEAVKHGLCQSKQLLELVDKNDYSKIVEETIKLKVKLMDKDPREKGMGLILVYGHTIGHAIETTTNKYTHGEAISIGMMIAAKISEKLGIADKKLVEIHKKHLEKLKLPTKLPNSIPINTILEKLYYDKKERKKDVTFVLLKDIEKPYQKANKFAIPIKKSLIKNVLNE